MRPAIALLTTLGLLLPAGRARAEYRPCARPVPDDAPPDVRKEILRLRDASEVTRAYAAYELYKMARKAQPAVPFLRHLLRDDSPLVSLNGFANARWSGPTCPGLLAAEALWAARPAEITDVLRRDPPTARLHTARFLAGMTRDGDALAALLLAAKDASAEVRHAAVLGLARSPDADALAAVRGALGDASVRIRARAVAALGKTKDAESLPALRNVLARDKDPWPKGYAAWYLGEMGDGGAVTALIGALGDPSAYVRGHAVSSLGVLGDARAIEPLLARANDPDAEVRREVGEALERFDDPRGAAAAVGDLASSDAARRQRAVGAIGRYPDAYAAHLIKALDDADPKVRQNAVEALSRAESEAAAAATALAGCLRGSGSRRLFRETALFVALARLGNPAVGELEKVLLSVPTTNRFGQTRDLAPRAARALAEIRTPEAMAAVEKGLSAPSAAARREAERLRKVRSYTRHSRRPARPAPERKPKPRRMPKPPAAPEPAVAARRPAKGVAAAPRRPARPTAHQARPEAGRGGPGYRLTGIIGCVAIVNGKNVRVGDTVGGAKVVTIRGMKVELESGGKRFAIGMSGGASRK